MKKPIIDSNRHALMNLYIFPLFFGSSSLILWDNDTRFLIVMKSDLNVRVEYVMSVMALWNLRRRNHVNCFVLTDFDFEDFDDFDVGGEGGDGWCSPALRRVLDSCRLLLLEVFCF